MKPASIHDRLPAEAVFVFNVSYTHLLPVIYSLTANAKDVMKSCKI